MNKNDDIKHIVMFSGGKDSTAMLLRMIELNMRIDKIFFCDTLFEFPELYDYIDKIESVIGRKIIRLKPNKSFEEWFYGKITRGKLKGKVRGFPFRLLPCYWTRESKIVPSKKSYTKKDIVYLGIASDEPKRIQKNSDNIRYPLIDWGWTEKDCVDYLKEKELLNPLYYKFNRLGCYFCPKQNINSLYFLWRDYPKLWDRLKFWNDENIRIGGGQILNKSIDYYEELFKNNYIPKKPKYKD